MKIRELLDSDIPNLRAMYAAQNFSYDFPDLKGAQVEAVLVVTEDDGTTLAAVAAERLVQLYFFCGEVEHPATKLCIIRSLHEHMAEKLKARGYHSAEAFLPPTLAAKFGRRLERTFGWMKNWQSWTKGF